MITLKNAPDYLLVRNRNGDEKEAYRESGSTRSMKSTLSWVFLGCIVLKNVVEDCLRFELSFWRQTLILMIEDSPTFTELIVNSHCRLSMLFIWFSISATHIWFHLFRCFTGTGMLMLSERFWISRVVLFWNLSLIWYLLWWQFIYNELIVNSHFRVVT